MVIPLRRTSRQKPKPAPEKKRSVGVKSLRAARKSVSAPAYDDEDPAEGSESEAVDEELGQVQSEEDDQPTSTLKEPGDAAQALQGAQGPSTEEGPVQESEIQIRIEEAEDEAAQAGVEQAEAEQTEAEQAEAGRAEVEQAEVEQGQQAEAGQPEPEDQSESEKDGSDTLADKKAFQRQLILRKVLMNKGT